MRGGKLPPLDILRIAFSEYTSSLLITSLESVSMWFEATSPKETYSTWMWAPVMILMFAYISLYRTGMNWNSGLQFPLNGGPCVQSTAVRARHRSLTPKSCCSSLFGPCQVRHFVGDAFGWTVRRWRSKRTWNNDFLGRPSRLCQSFWVIL